MISEIKSEIFEKAGERSIDEVIDLIFKAKTILKKERIDGKDKLSKTIDQIKVGSSKNEYFVDDGICYLPSEREVSGQTKKVKAFFIGDTHGDSYATQSIVEKIKFIETIEANTSFDHKRNEEFYNLIKHRDSSLFAFRTAVFGQIHTHKDLTDIMLVFLGDYIDRGRASLRNLEMVLALKVFYPDNVILIRGNHEEGGGFVPYEFPYDLKEKFGSKIGSELHEKYVSLFSLFPNVVLTGNNIVAVHGGIPSQDIKNLKDLIGKEKLFHQMRWNDPKEGIQEREFGNRSSMEFCVFGKKAFIRFMKAISAKVMIRSHEYPKDGSQKFFDSRLITIFSTGQGSTESGYQNMVSSPKFLEIDLFKKINKIKDKYIVKIF